MRSHIDRNEGITCPAARTWPTLAFQADLLATGNAGRNLDLDVFSGRQMHACFCATCGVFERDCERGMQILPRAGACTEVFALERRDRKSTRLNSSHPSNSY